MVDFCSSCGTIIIGKKGENVKCPGCGAEQKAKTTMAFSEKVEKKKELEIIDSDKSSEVHPTTPVECPKCGNMEAYYWTKQTRAGDEPETQFFKCTACRHQWREYR